MNPSHAYSYVLNPRGEGSDPTLRVIADGLVARAEELPRESAAGRLLRDAATSLLDADTALEREAPKP